MSDITLRVKAQFDEAQKAFGDLANSSEATRARMEEFAESFQTKKIDSFIDRQKLLEASLKGTRGETAAMEAASRNYQREIERLISRGLSPQSEEVQRLAGENQRLKDSIEQANRAKQAQADLMKNAERAFMATTAAIAAAGAAVLALTHRTAAMGGEFARSARLVGMSAEFLQELHYVAQRAGVTNLDYNLQRLNGTVVEVRNGTGKLTSFLEKNDAQLLGQLRNVQNNERAFMLLMDAISQAPDEFTRAELSMAAFGRRGQEMALIAADGADGINALREEARGFGLITNEAAANSEAFNDAQQRLQASLQGVKVQLTAGLLPGITAAVDAVANFIKNFDDWERVLAIAKHALIGLAAGLAAFMAIAKGYAVIQKITVAFKTLNAVMKANKFGLIAAIITAVLIPALLFLLRQWDIVQTFIDQGVARLQYAFGWFASQMRQGFTTAVNSVKIAFLSLAEIIVTRVLGSVASFLDVMGRLPFVGEMFQNASNAVRGFAEGFSEAADNARESSREVIESTRREQDAVREAHRERLANIDEEARARRAALREAEAENENPAAAASSPISLEEIRTYLDAMVALHEQADERIELSLRERLGSVAMTESQIRNDNISAIENFLQQRMRLESDDAEERLAFLKEQKEYLLSEYSGFGDYRIEIEKAVQRMIQSLQEETAEKAKASAEQMLKAYSAFFGGFSQLLGAAGKENRGFFILSRKMALVQSGINTALAITKTLASLPYLANVVKAIGVGAKGLAQKAKIVSSMIPSAETGGRFIVPASRGVDNTIMRVNPGEEVDVTPRGQVGAERESFNFSFVVDSQVFAEIINKQARAGELHTLQLAGNL